MLRQLAGQTAIYGISIVSRLLNYLLTPVLTRIMTTGEYGDYRYVRLIPFTMVVLTMMETGYFRFAGKAEGLHGRQEVFFDDLGAVSAVAVLFAALGILTPELSRVMDYPDHPSWYLDVAVVIALDVTAIPRVCGCGREQS